MCEEWSGGREKPGITIGYQIRHEAVSSHATRLLFCTTGILLRRLASDPEMNDVSNIVLDEVFNCIYYVIIKVALSTKRNFAEM